MCKKKTILEKVDDIMCGSDLKTINENSNKDGRVIPVQRDMIAGMVAKEYAQMVLPENVMEAHNQGLIHFHDLDYSPQYPMYNCMLIDIEGMFKNGFKMGNTEIEDPKSFGVACQVTAQVIAQVSSHIYGGNSINGIDRILAPYVKKSFKKHFINAVGWMEATSLTGLGLESVLGEIKHDNSLLKINYPTLHRIATELTLKEIKDGIQALEYEVNTLYSANGQTPFTTFGIQSDTTWEGREIQKAIFKNRIKGIGKNGKTPVFPKLVYMLAEGNNINPEDVNYDIKLLALECQSKRMYPDIVSKKLIEKTTGDFKFPMGCRSFLSSYQDEDGKYITDGRMNLGVVTLNLPRIAILSEGDEKKFFRLLDHSMATCFQALHFRITRLRGVTSDVAPILYQEGATGFRLKSGETIDKIFKNGYATISLGYIGIHETIMALYGEKLWGNDELKAKALHIVEYIKQATNREKESTGYAFGLYSTPSESLCYRFCEIDSERFGVISGVTDKGYYTNSFHLDVNEHATPFEKIEHESHYPQFASGGFISYVELNSLQKNLKALEMIWDYAMEHTPYFAVNTPTDLCFKCGYSGEFNATESGYFCPNCCNNDPKTVSVIRRCCGYLSEPSERPFNKGKQIEVTKRVKHM